jgi:hypothetical protein
MIVRYFSSVSLRMPVASGLLWLMQCLIVGVTTTAVRMLYRFELQK